MPSVEITTPESNKAVWRAPRPVTRNRPSWSAPTLVVYQDVVLSADRGLRRYRFLDVRDPIHGEPWSPLEPPGRRYRVLSRRGESPGA